MNCVYQLTVVCLCVGLTLANGSESNHQRTRNLNGQGVARSRSLFQLWETYTQHKRTSNVNAVKDKKSTCGHPSALSQQDKSDALNAHNSLRGQEGAANMLKMSYNEDLADRAQEWADQCIWDHGLTEMCDGTGLGQNMYLTAGSNYYPSVDSTAVAQNWFDEKSDYDFDKIYCPPGVMCGHYTQVVWADSREIGCGMTQCPSANVNGQIWNNAVIYVCNYAPAGNYRGVQPYIKGNACSQCPWVPGYGTNCDNGLCASCNVGSDYGCNCGYQSSCNGNGHFDSSKCGCTCDEGFYGDECEKSCACENADGYEYACQSWQSLCSQAVYKDFLMGVCKKTCGFCSTPDGAC